MLSEDQEQKLLVQWSRYKFFSGHKRLSDYLIAIPNGGSRHLLEAINLKRQGVKAGVPDIFIYIPNKQYHGLFIEMKRKRNFIVSEHQKETIERLVSIGYCARIAKGFEQAKEIIEDYLSQI